MRVHLDDVDADLRVALHRLFDRYGMQGVRNTVLDMAAPHDFAPDGLGNCRLCSLPYRASLHLNAEPEILPGLETIEPSPWVAMPDETTRAYLGNGCTASVVAGESSWRWLVYRQVLNMKTPVQRGTADSELDAREAAVRWFDESRANLAQPI